MTTTQAIALLLLGFLIGMLSGIFGVGGGAFLVPALVRVGGLGWPAANGLSLIQMIPAAALGAWQRGRQREVNTRLALLSVLGSIPGAFLGKSFVKWLAGWGVVQIGGRPVDLINLVLTLTFSGAVMYMSARMIQGARKEAPKPSGAPPAPEAFDKIPAWEAAGLGLAVGFASALLGIGGGFLFVPIAVQRFGLPAALAVGTSLFQMPFTAASGGLLYMSDPDLTMPYLWLIPLMAGSMSGVLIGVAISRRFNNRQYRLILGAMLFIVAAFLLATWGSKPKPEAKKDAAPAGAPNPAEASQSLNR